jgi:type I restriction enzyme S subunit
MIKHSPNAVLGDYIQTLKGYAFKSSWYTDMGTPIIKVSNFTDNSIDVSELTYIPNNIASKYQKYKLCPGDTVVQTVGSWPSAPKSVVGKVIRVPRNLTTSLLNQNAVKIIPDHRLDRVFCYYLLKSDFFKHFIINCAQGAASQASITLEDIKAFEFWLPPFESQRRIASILATYDDLIENNTCRIKILEEIAQNLYREWFQKFKFPGHEKVKLVESSFGMIPEGWEVKKISDVADIYRGKSYKSADIANENVGLPFLNLKCIERDGGFRYDGVKWFSGQFKDVHTAITGDIIMAVTDMTQERRIVARAARVPKTSNEKYIFSMDLVKILPIKATNNEYLYSAFRFSSFPDIIKQHANGANVLHLNPEHIGNFDMLYAPIEIQNNYSDICSSIFTECNVLQMKNANLRCTRDLLLPKLISGELDIENLDIDIGGIE